MADHNGINLLSKISPIATIVLSLVLIYTTVVQRNTAGNDQTKYNSERIENLVQQVGTLQSQVAQQQVIQAELNSVKEGQTDTRKAVDRLADELHSWQREERTFHTQQHK